MRMEVREAAEITETSTKRVLRLMRKEIVTQFIITRRSNYRSIQKNSG